MVNTTGTLGALALPGFLQAPPASWVAWVGRRWASTSATESWDGYSSEEAWARACVNRVRAGEGPAFDALIGVYAGRIYSHLYRLTRSREESEDLAQETFLRAYRYLASYDVERPFRNWLYMIATNVAMTKLRGQRSGDVELDWDWGAGAVGDARGEIAQRELRRSVAEAVNQLPPVVGALVHLHYFEGMTIRESAAILNMTDEAAKVALHRARRRLRGMLTEEER